MVYGFFDQKARSGASINKELTQELRKQVNKKFEKYRINVRFKDEICAAVLTEMVSLPFTNPGAKYSFSMIDFSPVMFGTFER